MLPSLGGLPIVTARDVSDAGVVVGAVASAITPTQPRPAISRAVAWVNGRVIDLNARISRRERIQLTDASAIDRFGRIATRGYRLDDVPLPCPIYKFDENTGEVTSDPNEVCRSERAFLLVPAP